MNTNALVNELERLPKVAFTIMLKFIEMGKEKDELFKHLRDKTDEAYLLNQILNNYKNLVSEIELATEQNNFVQVRNLLAKRKIEKHKYEL
tara:strand:+ start:131 stop:403 length:273 start_codon:yes stop_codon:yes gene_type:complete